MDRRRDEPASELLLLLSHDRHKDRTHERRGLNAACGGFVEKVMILLHSGSKLTVGILGSDVGESGFPYLSV